MRQATQQDIDLFMAAAMDNAEVYPFMTVSKYFSKMEVPKDDWSGIAMVTDDLKMFFEVTFDRCRDLECSISVFCLSSFHAGKAILGIKEIIRRYRPRAINSNVHSSNKKSLELNTKLLGPPCGIKKSYAWNMGTGAYEDLYLFRKVL